MDQNLISINIVARNAERTLARTLDSALGQQRVRIEIVFVDDASTDSTLGIAEEYKAKHPGIPFTIISNPHNLGIAKSRNLALKASKGTYVAVLDSDDTWTSDSKLAKQMAHFARNPDCVVVGTQMRLVYEDGTVSKSTRYATEDPDIRSRMLVFNQFCHSSVVMKNVGQTYDESLYIWEDYDMLLTLGQQGSFANLDETLVDYLFVPKKYGFKRKLRLIQTEFQIITCHHKKYPNVLIGYIKLTVKLMLTLFHLK